MNEMKMTSQDGRSPPIWHGSPQAYSSYYSNATKLLYNAAG
jgi:hypothetical protein